VLDETQGAIERILSDKGVIDAARRAVDACRVMEEAFEDAMVDDYDDFLPACRAIPDKGDHHVLAAALKTQAAVIVTENSKHFPEKILAPFGVEVRSADEFIADTIMLDVGRAVAAIGQMRRKLKDPPFSTEALLLKMEAQGLTETVDVLGSYVQFL